MNSYKNNSFNFDGIYFIKSIETNLYFSIHNNILILTKNKEYFRLKSISYNLYIIESRFKNKRIGVDGNNKIKIYNNQIDVKNFDKIYWNIIPINNDEALILNKYNLKYLQIINNTVQFSNCILYNWDKSNKIVLKKNYFFTFIKLFQDDKLNKKNINKINNEPVDVLIKYIDLTDKNLIRDNISQIYKDYDNEELRYCIRSILNYIRWTRKIFILMPNEKVKFFKSKDEIKEKIIYIKDKDILGYDCANIHAFTFNLFKMKKYGISNNFIYMEDDFFIGKILNKHDFFYYDEKKNKVFPYILTFFFDEINSTNILINYNEMFRIKNLIHPHSDEGWKFSILSTEKYFIERFSNFSLINTRFTHNAIAQNIDDLKLIFKEIQNYEYINETLFSKMRHILTLNQPYFFNLYLLNILHRKVNSIPYQYIPIELINKYKLNVELFVLNTGGNHIPLKRQIYIQKKLMEKRFPIRVFYEKANKEKSIIFDIKKEYFHIILKIFTLVYLFKIYTLIVIVLKLKCLNKTII